MKKINKLFAGLALVGVCVSCESLLDQKPQGTLSSGDLNDPDKVEQMIVSAYSLAGSQHFNKQMGLPYNEGSVRGGEAYKGCSGTGDNAEEHRWETFTYLQPTDVGQLDYLWWWHYCVAGRVNDALRRAQALTTEEYPLRDARIGELRFLRGHVYFYMKECFKFFPWIDENTPEDQYDKVSNVEFSDQELWGKIIDDFRAAVASLPETQDEVGRPTKWAAKGYLAKALLFAAYEQDDRNNVVGVNEAKLREVAELCEDIINNAGKSLRPDFAENFLCEYENNTESLWAIQYSANNDNSPVGRVNSWLIYPINDEYGCCGCFQPSINLMNCFKTVNGVPDFDNYNTGIIMDDKEAWTTTPVDPRLMHTACVPGMPWKYQSDYIMKDSWARTPEVYGYSMSQKMIVLASCDCFKKTNPFMGSGLNWDVLRLDEIMLWRAEALIELNQNLDEAMSLINRIRERSATSTARLVFEDGTPTGKFDVRPYTPGVNCPAWTQDFAREALRWERHLEFATEGKWFFDLVRWGIAEETINAYFEVEKTRHTYLKDAHFTKNKDEYFPIPQVQIDYVKGLYKQNVGWE